MFSQSYPRLVKGLMGIFKVSGLNHWGVFGEIDQSSVNKLPFIPKRKLKKKDEFIVLKGITQRRKFWCPIYFTTEKQ